MAKSLRERYETVRKRIATDEDMGDEEREDAIVIEAIRDVAFEEVGNTAVLGAADPFGAVDSPIADVAERYEDMTGTEKTAAWVGHARASLDPEKPRRRNGTVSSDPELGPKLK